MAGLEIRALTGLRGIAAILFVVFHEAGNFAGTGPAATFLRHGYNAVDLFFVLSGFVMALTYRAKFRGGRASCGSILFEVAPKGCYTQFTPQWRPNLRLGFPPWPLWRAPHNLQLYRKTWPDYFARVTIPEPRPSDR